VEGRTNAEAARLLGCPKGTVLSRLAWARERLRARLTRRGLALPAGLFTAALGQDTLSAAVPPALARSTIQSALSFAAGHAAGAVPAHVDALAERVSGALAMTKVRIVTTLLVGVGALATVAGLGALAGGQDRPNAAADERAVVRANPGADGRPEEAGSVSVKSMPPAVVRTDPQAGDTQVDAAKVTEIRVTFSKEMADRVWSWSQISDDTFPKVTGKPHYEKDRRTCVLPVKLEPGKTYVFWLNSEKFPGFRDTAGRPSVPYLLVFETRP
jgi:RNA polymerase sigma-70 factor (ECF subfamily)